MSARFRWMVAAWFVRTRGRIEHIDVMIASFFAKDLA